MPTDLVLIEDPEIAALAKRHNAAGSIGMQLLNLIGGQAENLLERLPDSVKDKLENATLNALMVSLRAADASRQVVGDQKPWLNTAFAAAMGAAGGAGGIPTALAELPVTTTVLLRAILGVAQEYGFDPADDETRRQALHVFASAGPMAGDDGVDMGFLSARVTLTGRSLNALAAQIAPGLSLVLGRKLATQAVPVLGAAAGAATNYAYSSYYQEMAHVHFGLLSLARDRGHDVDALQKSLKLEITQQKTRRPITRS